VQSRSIVFKAIIVLLLGAILVAVAMLAMILLPVVLLVAVWLWLRSQALKMRLGQVELSMPLKVVAPGESWPLTLKFTARRSFMINSISLKISGIESAASGSGTNKTTHNHQLALESHLIREGGMVEAGETVEEAFQVLFPNTGAYSFEAADNSIKWTAEVRIDIPRFPDWSSTETLQLIPIDFLGEASVTAAAKNKRHSAADAENPDEVWDETEDSPSAGTDSRKQSPDLIDDQPTSLRRAQKAASIVDLVAQLNAVSRHSTQRTEIVRTAAGTIMAVSITIDRTVSTIGLMAGDESYDSGKTVTGTIDGTRQLIQVLAKPASNSVLASLQSGDSWQTTITPIEWDTLYNRINAKEV